MRRGGSAVLSVTAADDAIGQTRSAILVEALAAHGWKEHGNLRIDWRSGAGDRARIAGLADELIALKPDILLAVGTPSVEELRRRTAMIPIVFAVVTDPVSQGFVQNLAHPGRATSPASPITTARWPANGWRC
ncbi:hypothetical protein BRDID11002_63400 [Bradyrhizobium diazoefficiens]